ncbi:DUF559 domain-containing protein [Dokdonella sp.]|uniref:DUF559 domain-containing protein n=1 Tax=Dokdonella sp. TaxID=2291710 RepID=UPI0031B8367E
MTDAEHRLWFHLRKHQLADLRFRRQHPIAGYIATLPEARLVIELDGSQHLDSSSDEYVKRRFAKRVSRSFAFGMMTCCFAQRVLRPF